MGKKRKSASDGHDRVGRRRRLEKALRDNLKRRKEQARARRSESGGNRTTGGDTG